MPPNAGRPSNAPDDDYINMRLDPDDDDMNRLVDLDLD
jgi:hypothetical protein